MKLDTVKTATSWIVGFGAGTIVTAFVKNTTQPATHVDAETGETYTDKVSLINKVSVPVTGLVISAMVKDACTDYTNQKIDELAAFYQKHFSNSVTEATSK